MNTKNKEFERLFDKYKGYIGKYFITGEEYVYIKNVLSECDSNNKNYIRIEYYTFTMENDFDDFPVFNFYGCEEAFYDENNLCNEWIKNLLEISKNSFEKAFNQYKMNMEKYLKLNEYGK
jgi:hypothetical protein